MTPAASPTGGASSRSQPAGTRGENRARSSATKPRTKAPRINVAVRPESTKLLVVLSGRTATLILGAFVLGFVALDLARFSPRVPAGWERLLAPPVGFAAGVMGGITSAPGTALALYFVALGMDKREFVRSIAFTFLVVKAVQLAALGWYGLLGWPLVLGSLGLTAAALAGFGLGLRVQDRLDQRAFNRGVLVFLATLGAWLVVRTL